MASWRIELLIKGIEIDKEHTQALKDTLQSFIEEMAETTDIKFEMKDELLRINISAQNIDPHATTNKVDAFSNMLNENLSEYSGFIRIFQMLKKEKEITILPPTSTAIETITQQTEEAIIQESSEQSTKQIIAEILEGRTVQPKPQPQLHIRYNAVFPSLKGDFRVVVDIPTEFSQEVRQRPRQNFDDMVKISQSDIAPLSSAFRQLQKSETWSDEDLARVILNFVQNIPYVKNKVATGMEDYHSFAIETIVAGIGDCEDKTILGAAIYKNLGYNVILINPPAHITIGIAGNYKGYGIDYEGEHYYYAEVTTPGWQIGELRADLLKTDMNVITIN